MLGELGLDPAEPIAVVRTPPEVSLYHRFENDLFARCSSALRGARRWCCRVPRRSARSWPARGGFVVPERASTRPAWSRFADLVVSAGGTMNREAVALGTPVYTTFEGRLGAVDEQLLARGAAAAAVESRRGRSQSAPGSAQERVRRDPRELVKLLLSAAK